MKLTMWALVHYSKRKELRGPRTMSVVTPHQEQTNPLKTDIQSMMAQLEHYWSQQGCVILPAYDMEMGAGTSSPWTVFRALGSAPWRAAFTQPCRRPSDGRFGQNPNRMQKFHQFQVVLKPTPDDVQALLLESYAFLGIDIHAHDIRFVEDDWENPSLGAAGLGWEVWLDGMEVTQFTYFQQMGGIPCSVVTAELTYGIERLALFLQHKSSFFSLQWNQATTHNGPGMTWGDMHLVAEQQWSEWNFHQAPVEDLLPHFHRVLSWGDTALAKDLILPAYDNSIQANHLFNLLDARGALSTAQRAESIASIRALVKRCCVRWLEIYEPSQGDVS